MLVNMPPGAALFRVIQIKPADDPALTPYEDLSKLVFWFDPDPYGHSSGIKPVHGYALPIGLDQISTPAVDKSDVPTRNEGGARPHGFDLIRHIRGAMSCECSGSAYRTAAEDAVQPGWEMVKSRFSRFLHRGLSPSDCIERAVRQGKHPAEIARQDYRARSQEGRQHVEIANGQGGPPNG